MDVDKTNRTFILESDDCTLLGIDTITKVRFSDSGWLCRRALQMQDLAKREFPNVIYDEAYLRDIGDMITTIVDTLVDELGSS